LPLINRFPFYQLSGEVKPSRYTQASPHYNRPAMKNGNGNEGGFNRYWWIAFGLLIGLLTTGIILLLSGPPRGTSIQLAPAPTSSPLVVHVSGAVILPGLYELPLGSRAQDAIDAAGGLTDDADTDRINLARVLIDSQQIHVPFIGEDSDELVSFPININFASVEQLILLPGIGPITAQAIINYREDHGSFLRIADIQDVPGIGPSTFESIEGLISTDG
jgi:competence protein ComEA